MDALTDQDRVEFLARAGDVMTEMLGHTLATLESDDDFNDTQYAAARNAILTWHRMRHICTSD